MTPSMRTRAPRLDQVHREDCARLVRPMLSVADLVGRVGSLLIMGGVMETLLSLVPLTRRDLVSFHSAVCFQNGQ